MTALRQRFIEDLQLQGKSDRTQQAYVRAVRMLAEHVHTPPDQLTDEQIRQYFLYVKNTRHWLIDDNYSWRSTTITFEVKKFLSMINFNRFVTA